MKLLKPTWVTHDGKPIFSINIHPDGSKFATGGQGDDSGRVVIWNMSPVVSEKAEQDPNIPKLLCQMDNHLACVNCVRWSNSGQYLASGGDDKLVMIWQLSRYSAGSTIFGGGGKTNVEHWRCVSTLRAHSGDVLDLGWSPNDQFLASSSVDNTVRIWNMMNMPESVAVLKGHTGLVKGIAWDPIGKYIASQSDDKSVRIWKTGDWKQETVVTEPFEECGGTTHVLRLDWSPDGQYLVSAHAMNGGGPTAQIIEREGWKTDKDFVGHRKAITCVSFNSNMLRKATTHKGTSYCCCAIGSRDRALSIWLTALKRPLVVIHELFQNSVLDLSWSRTGYQLMACSWDGSVAYIEFKESELGQVVGIEEKETLFQRMYGKKSFVSSANNKTTAVIEDPDWIEPPVVNPVAEESIISNESRSASRPSHIAKGPIDKQIETRTVDGRRRITPVFIPPPMEEDEGPVAASATNSSNPMPTFSSSTEAKSKIVVEKRDEVTKPGITNTPQTQAGRVEASNALLTRRLERSDEKPVVAAKRMKIATGETSAAGAPVVTCQTSEKVSISSLPVPKTLNIQGPGGRNFEVENNAHFVGHKIAVHKLMCVLASKVQWEIFLSSAIVACVSTSFGVTVACSDSTIHCCAIADGTRLFPPVKLQGSAALLRAQDHFVLVMTTLGVISVWNFQTKKSVVKTSVQNLIDQDGSATITSCSVRETGVPIVTLSNGKTYTYSLDMESWLQLSDAQDPLRHGSDLQGLPGGSSGTASLVNIPDLKMICTISYIDAKLTSFVELNSTAEYRTWFLAKVKYMAHQGMEERLRCLCEDLLGPVHRSSQRGKNWQPVLMSIKKHELLQQVLNVMAINVKLQRLCTEIKQQLVLLSE